MRALRLEDIDRLALGEIERPAIGDDELLIRTGAATICTSDLHDLHANPFGIALPATLGHEGAGTVVAVGAAVSGFAPGDRVAAHPVHPCHRCAACTSGMDHLCTDMRHFGINMPGTFAESFVVRTDRARHMPDGMDFATAALMEPVCVSLEALLQARLPASGSLLIIGDGPFGVMMARLARHRGVARVVLAGRHIDRLAFAPDAVTLNTADGDGRAIMLDAGRPDGFDAVIIAVSSRDAVADGLAALRPKGRLVVFAPIPGLTPIDLSDVLMRELEIVGSVNDRGLLDDAMRLLADSHLDLQELVTHRYPIEAYRQAFALAEHRQEPAMKIAFEFEGTDADGGAA
jgi:threonine dehydrogenase-like Zn-dependent dehydrogenase